MNIISKIKTVFSTTSIKTKIYYLTASTVIISCLVIGTFSYAISKNALLSNSRENFSSILKQIGSVLDDRVMIVKNLSFQMSQDPELQEMLTLSDDEISSQVLAKQNSNFNKILILKGFDISFISDAYVIGENSEMIRSYHHSTSKENLSTEMFQQISKNLTSNTPYDWVTIGNDTYFVRQILDIKTNKNFGVLCYKMADSFFKFQHSTAILDDDSIIVLDNQQETIKKGKKVAELEWHSLFQKKILNNFLLTQPQLIMNLQPT